MVPYIFFNVVNFYEYFIDRKNAYALFLGYGFIYIFQIILFRLSTYPCIFHPLKLLQTKDMISSPLLPEWFYFSLFATFSAL